MIKKAINIKTKASLQLFSRIKKIDFEYPKSYKPVKKKKDKANWDYKNKNKSIENLSATNISQSQAQASKKK